MPVDKKPNSGFTGAEKIHLVPLFDKELAGLDANINSTEYRQSHILFQHLINCGIDDQSLKVLMARKQLEGHGVIRDVHGAYDTITDVDKQAFPRHSGALKAARTLLQNPSELTVDKFKQSVANILPSYKPNGVTQAELQQLNENKRYLVKELMPDLEDEKQLLAMRLLQQILPYTHSLDLDQLSRFDPVKGEYVFKQTGLPLLKELAQHIIDSGKAQDKKSQDDKSITLPPQASDILDIEKTLGLLNDNEDEIAKTETTLDDTTVELKQARVTQAPQELEELAVFYHGRKQVWQQQLKALQQSLLETEQVIKTKLEQIRQTQQRIEQQTKTNNETLTQFKAALMAVGHLRSELLLAKRARDDELSIIKLEKDIEQQQQVINQGYKNQKALFDLKAQLLDQETQLVEKQKLLSQQQSAIPSQIAELEKQINFASLIIKARNNYDELVKRIGEECQSTMRASLKDFEAQVLKWVNRYRKILDKFGKTFAEFSKATDETGQSLSDAAGNTLFNSPHMDNFIKFIGPFGYLGLGLKITRTILVVGGLINDLVKSRQRLQNENKKQVLKELFDKEGRLEFLTDKIPAIAFDTTALILKLTLHASPAGIILGSIATAYDMTQEIVWAYKHVQKFKEERAHLLQLHESIVPKIRACTQDLARINIAKQQLKHTNKEIGDIITQITSDNLSSEQYQALAERKEQLIQYRDQLNSNFADLFGKEQEIRQTRQAYLKVSTSLQKSIDKLDQKIIGECRDTIIRTMMNVVMMAGILSISFAPHVGIILLCIGTLLHFGFSVFKHIEKKVKQAKAQLAEEQELQQQAANEVAEKTSPIDGCNDDDFQQVTDPLPDVVPITRTLNEEIIAPENNMEVPQDHPLATKSQPTPIMVSGNEDVINSQTKMLLQLGNTAQVSPIELQPKHCRVDSHPIMSQDFDDPDNPQAQLSGAAILAKKQHCVVETQQPYFSQPPSTVVMLGKNLECSLQQSKEKDDNLSTENTREYESYSVTA